MMSTEHPDNLRFTVGGVEQHCSHLSINGVLVKAARIVALASEQQEGSEADHVRDLRKFSEDLTRAKRLIMDLWDRFPEARPMLEARTGNWFVLGTDRYAAPVVRNDNGTA